MHMPVYPYLTHTHSFTRPAHPARPLSGCENCSFLEMENDSSRVHTCTSAYFEGVIAMCQPNNSWVSRWQQIASFLPGMYAVQVVGELPQEDIDMCKAKVHQECIRSSRRKCSCNMCALYVRFSHTLTHIHPIPS